MFLRGILGRFRHTGLLIAPVLACLLVLPSLQAWAQAATTPCDPQFMQAMEARAWLEAQREITQNQNLIAKPDSVLEYSCFNQFLNVAVSNFTVGGINRQFSETDAWATPGFDATTTDQAMTQVVGKALLAYLNGNFPDPQPYIGGRLPGQVPDRGWGGTVTGGAYNCSEMRKVWEHARCLNFMTDHNDEDGFYDFNWYQANDPRDLPPALQSCKALGGTLGNTYTTNMQQAFNSHQAMFVLPAGDDKPAKGGTYLTDTVNTYFDLILPVGGPAPAPNRCGAAIQTGVTIHRNNETTPDAVCSNPGCTYDGNQCN